MPNIPTYTASDPESLIRISDLGSEAWANAARNIGRLGLEGAQRTEAGFKAAAAGLEKFGQQLQEHQDAQDTLKLVNGLSDMETRHDQEINAIKTDPSISPADLPGRLAQAYQSHLGDLNTFAQGFAHSSDKVQLEIARQTAQQKLQMQRKFEADSANATGVATDYNLTKNFNETTAGLGTNPTPTDLNRALEKNENARQAALALPGLNFDQRDKINKLYDQRNDQLAKSGITSMLNQDPSKLGDYYQQYNRYITPETRTELENHARTIGRQKAALAVHQEANDYANKFLGNPPTGQAPGAATTPTPQSFTPPTGNEVAPGPRTEDDPRGKIPVIRYWASRNGVDPDTAVAVARTEGLGRFKNPDEPSYTAFQLNMDNGLGNKFQRETGKDPTLPENEDAAIKWTMENWRRNGGWEPFHGARDNGIGVWDGADSSFRPQPTTNIASQPPRGASPIPQAVRGGAVATGDSIAAGLIRFGGVSGKENRNALLDWSNGNTAAGGSPPDMVAKNIANLPDETFKGKPVILSTGASNAGQMDPADAEQAIRDQIQTLKDKGAASITILGVGSKVAKWNPILQQIAKDENVTFSGPIKYTGDGIHPTNYRDFAHGIPVGEGSGSSTPPTGGGVARGTANFASYENFGDPHSAGWEDQNLTTIHSKSGVEFQVNKKSAQAFQGFIDELEQRGYEIGSGGGYNLRNIRGGSRLSQHAFGNAIDINPDDNPMGTGPLKTNLPRDISDIAARHGLIWGGDWDGRKDPMHFEWAGPQGVEGGRIRLAQATPQTMTDASGGGNQNQPAPAAGGGANAPLPPYPTKEQIFNDKMARMPDWVRNDPEYRTIYEQESQHFADDAMSKIKLGLGDKPKALDNELKNGLAQLEKGDDFDYNEDTIRHYFEPAVAEQKIETLKEAKAIGQQLGRIQQTPVPEIISTMESLNDSLRLPTTEAFLEHNKMVGAYRAAATKFLEGIGMMPGKDNSKADPAGYLISIDPNLREKFIQNIDNPDVAQEYAQTMITRQTQLGIPADRQHILPKQTADNLARQLLSNPRDAAVNLQSFYHQWGDQSEQAWRDLVEEGNLPPAFQLMPQLDPTAANLLARRMSQQEDMSGKLTPADRAGKNEAFWKNMVGDQQYKAIQDAIRIDPDVRKFRVSLMNAGASREEVEGFMSGLDTLALSKSAYDSNGTTDVTTAAGYAITAAIKNNYTWLGSMNARIPNAVASTVSDNAGFLTDNLSRDNVRVPTDRAGNALYGGKGQPSVETWIAQVRAGQNWMTTRHGDGVQLLDQDRNPVLRNDGSPIILKFSDPRMQSTVVPPAPTYSGPY